MQKPNPVYEVEELMSCGDKKHNSLGWQRDEHKVAT